MQVFIYLLKLISLPYIKLLNFLLHPKNAQIPMFNKIIFTASLVIVIFLQSQLNLSYKDSSILYSILLFLSLLYFIAKKLRNQEEMDIYQGFLRIEYQTFKNFDIVFLNFVTILFLILFFVALPMLLLNLNHLYDNIFIIKNNLTIFQEFMAFFLSILQSTPILNYFIIIEQSEMITFTKLGQSMNFLVEIMIYITIYSTIKNYVIKLLFEKKLLKAIENEDSKADIRLIQQRISSLPNSFKTDLLGLINGKNKDQKIARRAVNILFYSKTITFPQTFLYNLNHHQKELQKLGLKRIIELLQDNTIQFEKQYIEKIKNSIKYHKRQKHSESIINRLNEIENIIKFYSLNDRVKSIGVR